MWRKLISDFLSQFIDTPTPIELRPFGPITVQRLEEEARFERAKKLIRREQIKNFFWPFRKK